MQAQVVDADGNTNTFAALVERNNMFWIENVPLNGASQITLQATDAAGHMTTNSLTISPSDLLLTIGSTPSGDALYQPSGSVSGTVGDPNATVMVNGTNAVVDGSYTNADGSYNWEADSVPVYGMGTATFDAVAYPPSQNNAGTSRAMTAARPMLSNNTPPPANASRAVTMDPAIVITHYNFTEIYGENFGPDDDSQLLWARSYDRQWQTNANGLMQQTYQANETVIEGYGGPSPSPGTQNWSDPAPFYPDGFIASDWDVDAGSLDVFHSLEQGVHHHWDYVNGSSADVTVGADTHWTLYTGGKSGINRQTLFELYATACSFGRSPSGPWDWGLYWYLAPINGVVGTGIEALGQAFGSDGLLWTVQAGNSAVDLGINTPGNNDSSVNEWQQGYKLTLTATANGNSFDLSTNTPEFCAGQEVDLQATWNPPLPDGAQTSYHWYAMINFLNAWNPPVTADGSPWPTVSDAIATNNPSPAWWYDGGNKLVICDTTNIFSNGQMIEFLGQGNVSIYRPQVKFPFPGIAIQPMIPMLTNGLLELGASPGGYGVANFSAKISSKTNFPGEANWVQLINRSGTYQFQTTSGQYWLDNDPFYNTHGIGGTNDDTPVNPQGGIPFDDNPSVSVSHIPFSATSIDDKFQTYLVFKPDPQSSSIWVTLGIVTWEWSGSETTTSLGTETLTSSWTNGPTYTDSAALPEWLHVLHNK